MVMSDLGAEKEVSIREVIKVIQESQAIKASNEKLIKQSIILEKLSNDLKLNNEQMKINDVLKDEFLYTVTHELRTPLTSIRALSEILQDNPDLEELEKKQYLDAIVQETARLSHLISQVLVLERYESGKHHLRIEKIDCNELVHDVLQRVDTLKKDKGIKIDYALPSMPTISADKDLLFQVFYNLLTNAIKFAKSNIIIKGDFLDSMLKFSVEDDGEGIKQTDLPYLFDKFFQSHNQTIKKPQGSGLGLAISKKIIEMHNGKIYVESVEGHGSIFSFELPLKIFS
jgi:signal transduction histidine kinase